MDSGTLPSRSSAAKGGKESNDMGKRMLGREEALLAGLVRKGSVKKWHPNELLRSPCCQDGKAADLRIDRMRHYIKNLNHILHKIIAKHIWRNKQGWAA